MEPKTLSWPGILPIPVYGTSVNFHISSRLASALSVLMVVLQSFHFLQSNSVDVNCILPNRSIPKKIGGGMEVLGFSPILLIFLFYISILTGSLWSFFFFILYGCLGEVCAHFSHAQAAYILCLFLIIHRCCFVKPLQLSGCLAEWCEGAFGLC